MIKNFLKIISLIILLICIAPELFSKPLTTDTCSQLQYHSVLEQTNIEAYCAGQHPEFLSISVAVDPASNATNLKNIKDKIATETELLRSKTKEIKKQAKVLKFIFDHVQTTFLKQYDLEAGFSEMFSTGKYNCLTATILYATLLDNLSIKHTLKFMPGHVYLIVNADEEPYIFETTDPVGGFIELSKAVQDKAMQGLRVAQYMLSDNKPNDKTSNFLDSYFIKLNNLDMKGLIGYQYVNLAIFKLNKQEYFDAYNYIEKAKVFTPTDELNSLSTQLLGQAIDQADHTSTNRARLMVKLYSSMKSPNKKHILLEDFKSIIYECLAGSFPAPDSIQLISKIMVDGIADADVKTALTDVYEQSYLYYLVTKAPSEKRLSGVYKLYDDGNKNPAIEEILSEEIINLTESHGLSVEELEILDSLVTLYPKLVQLEKYKNTRCMLLVNLAANAFRMNNETSGDEFLQKFETYQVSTANAKSYCSPATAYSLAGSYYFKKGNHAKAKAVLNKGLLYDPDNWELKEKLREMK